MVGGGAGLDYDQVRHLYWAFHSSKYWTMDWPVQETMIINWARADAPEPWKNG